MKYGICMLAAVAVREAPSMKSQMTNQLLFGELVTINDTTNDWFLVETVDDGFTGWVQNNQLKELSKADFNTLKEAKPYYLQTLSAQIKVNKAIIPVFRGARFNGWNQGVFNVAGEKYYYKKAVHGVPENAGTREILKVAGYYLNVPFLQGGRTPLGIDSAGLVQMAFKMNGINLPRHADQQVDKGEQILFVEASAPGDLAFFESDDGTISHVGIILKGNKILHSSGKVRIDTLDHQGIFNTEAGKYTHRLRVVKRIIQL